MYIVNIIQKEKNTKEEDSRKMISFRQKGQLTV